MALRVESHKVTLAIASAVLSDVGAAFGGKSANAMKRLGDKLEKLC